MMRWWRLHVEVDVPKRIGVAGDAIERMASGIITDLQAGYRATVVLPDYWVQIRSQLERKKTTPGASETNQGLIDL
ncbi:hypothetical protein OAF45_00100 [Candidatus Latescibacteria bacterium]|nr:hypothetical protein [Candidatus Latescibacterota bacterium]